MLIDINIDNIDNYIPVYNKIKNTDLYYSYSLKTPISLETNLININIIIDDYDELTILVNNNLLIKELIEFIENTYPVDIITDILYLNNCVNYDNTLFEENIVNNSTITIYTNNNIYNDFFRNINENYNNNQDINNDGTINISIDNNFLDIFDNFYNDVEQNNTLTIDQINNNYPETLYSNNNSIQCVICYLDIKLNDNIRKTNCNHIFHSECIDEWLLNFNNSCPICKNNL